MSRCDIGFKGNAQHKVWPYLLRGMKMVQANQV
jgi:hypothetical protein